MGFLIDVALPLSLAFIMLSLGVGLTVSDFTRVGRQPTSFLIGAAHQMILLPIVAFCVALVFGLEGALAVGLMILAFCPGGVTTNMLAKMANGDVALSVSLTAVISLLSVLTVPVLLVLAVDHFMETAAPDVDILGIAISMFAITVVPIVIGMIFKGLAPVTADKVEPILDVIAKILFAVIVLAALATNWDIFAENLFSLGPALFVLCGALIALGFYIPKLLGRPSSEARTVAVETGIQNGTLALAVAAFLGAGTDGFSAFAIPAAVYSIIMYIVGLPAVWFMRKA